MSQTNSQPDGNSVPDVTEEKPLPDSLYGLVVNPEVHDTPIRCEQEKIKTVHQWIMQHSINNETGLPEVSKRIIMCTHCGYVSVKK
jgi:hypothetical protein